MANLLTTTISGGLIHKEGTATLSGTSLSVDLSTGRTFEVDLEGSSGNIATFNITNDPTLPDAGGLVIVNVAILSDAVARDASK